MEQIFDVNSNFDFSTLSLAHPVGIQGGAYFTKLTVDNNPLFIQMTSCKTKQGIVKTGKKSYLDLMFTANDIEIVEWVENLEKKVQEMIYEKRELWFNNELELEDIEGAFTSPIRVYKSGKYYLVRVYIQSHVPGTNGFTCYDENENLVKPEDITENTLIIPLLEVRGIKFSSRNFQIDTVLRQIMTVEENKFLKKCLIKPKVVSANNLNTNEHDENNVEADENNVEADENNVEADEEAHENNVEADEEADENNVEADELITLDEKDMSTEELNEENGEIKKKQAIKVETENSKKENIVNGLTDNAIDEEDVEGLEKEEYLENDINQKEIKKELEEFEIDLGDSLETSNLKLKTEKDIHIELWREARIKAKEVRSLAIAAYLEAKNIKQAYNLNDLEESADELDEILESGHF